MFSASILINATSSNLTGSEKPTLRQDLDDSYLKPDIVLRGALGVIGDLSEQIVKYQLGLFREYGIETLSANKQQNARGLVSFSQRVRLTVEVLTVRRQTASQINAQSATKIWCPATSKDLRLGYSTRR